MRLADSGKDSNRVSPDCLGTVTFDRRGKRQSRSLKENHQTAVCSGSSLLVLARGAVVGVGMTTRIRVPESPDSMLIVPENCRTLSRMPRIPTPEPFD